MIAIMGGGHSDDVNRIKGCIDGTELSSSRLGMGKTEKIASSIYIENLK